MFDQIDIETLILKYLQGKLAEEEKRQLDEWLKDDRNKKLFSRLVNKQRILVKMERLDEYDWEKRLTFNVITEIRNYLYTSTRNACLDHLKHEQIKQKHAIQLLTTASQEEEQEYILEEEVDALIHQAIGTLPRQAQKMVIMTLNGDSNLEIAQKLNITVNTVKSTKLKAYQILRKRLRNVQWFLALLT